MTDAPHPSPDEVRALASELRARKQTGHCGESTSEAIHRERSNEPLEQAARALTALLARAEEQQRSLALAGRTLMKLDATNAALSDRMLDAEKRAEGAEREVEGVRDALREFDHTGGGESLAETAEVAASAFGHVKHRAETAEASLSALVERNRELEAMVSNARVSPHPPTESGLQSPAVGDSQGDQ